MLINLTKSKLFTIEPDARFSNEYGLPKGVWVELWKRYKLMGYTTDEMCEYLLIKTGRHASSNSMRRWIKRTEIYSIASPIVKKGAECVQSEIFGEYQMIVIKELSKHIRRGEAKNSRTII